MKQTNVITMGAAALVAVIAVSGVAFSTFAASPDTDTELKGFGNGQFMGRNLTDEQKTEMEEKRAEMQTDREARRAEMQSAIEGGFANWSTLVKEQRGDDAQILEVINETNFGEFVAAHEQMEAGHGLTEAGRAALENLGVERGNMGMGKGHMGGMRNGGQANGMHNR